MRSFATFAACGGADKLRRQTRCAAGHVERVARQAETHLRTGSRCQKPRRSARRNRARFSGPQGLELLERDREAHERPEHRVLIAAGVPGPAGKAFYRLQGVHGDAEDRRNKLSLTKFNRRLRELGWESGVSSGVRWVGKFNPSLSLRGEDGRKQ